MAVVAVVVVAAAVVVATGSPRAGSVEASVDTSVENDGGLPGGVKAEEEEEEEAPTAAVVTGQYGSRRRSSASCQQLEVRRGVGGGGPRNPLSAYCLPPHTHLPAAARARPHPVVSPQPNRHLGASVSRRLAVRCVRSQSEIRSPDEYGWWCRQLGGVSGQNQNTERPGKNTQLAFIESSPCQPHPHPHPDVDLWPSSPVAVFEAWLEPKPSATDCTPSATPPATPPAAPPATPATSMREDDGDGVVEG